MGAVPQDLLNKEQRLISRRIANQAFFDIFFDPDVQQLATTRQRAVETGTQTGQVVNLNNDQLVGPKGLACPLRVHTAHSALPGFPRTGPDRKLP